MPPAAAAEAQSTAADAPGSQDQPAPRQTPASRDACADAFANGALLSKTVALLFPASDRRAGLPPLPTHFLLIGAVNPSLATQTIGGLTFPQFARDASQWLVVTAQSPDGL